VGLSWIAFVLFLFFTWNNPAKLGDPLQLRLDYIPESAFWQIYGDWFPRDFLGPLRLLNLAVVVIVLYGVLTRFWRPADRLLGWLLIPLGGATLYVFILHLVFALVVASLPFIDQRSLLTGTLTHVAILALLWIMVRTSFLFRWIPR
jgi:fucose 4-O-acetylase-like acetyltransferase